MSSFFDIVISFVAALIAAAFAHFGASEIPVSRSNPPRPAQEAPSAYTPPAEPAVPASMAAPPEPPAPVEPVSVREIEANALKADHMAAMAEHEAQMKAHETQMRAYEAIIEAAEKAHFPSHLSFQLDLPKDSHAINALSPTDKSALDAANARHLELSSLIAPPQDEACEEADEHKTPRLTAEADTGISIRL